MKACRTYGTAGAFRRALEERLKTAAHAGATDVNRLRRQVAFDRLLARLFQQGAAFLVLKGGYAMELRFQKARTTKDLDFTLRPGSLPRPERMLILDHLQQAASQDLHDFFEFLIGEPTAELDAAPYGGARYPAESRMDGRVFARFHLDVGAGDVLIDPVETVVGRNWLEFAGIPSPTIWMISKEQQLAEKLHAYTLPREGAPNSRVRDLIDMVLLVRSGDLSSTRLLRALHQTFERRGTHPLPDAIRPPAEEWSKLYAAMARECGLEEDLMGGLAQVSDYFQSLGLGKSG